MKDKSVEEGKEEEEEVDIDIVEELKTDRNELNGFEITLLVIFVLLIACTTILLSFSPKIRNYVTYPLIHQEELNFKNWLYISSFSTIIASIGFPLTILNFTIASLIKSFPIAFSIAVSANVGASLLIFIIGRFLLSYRLKIAFKENKFYQTLQYAVRKDPLKFTILFKLLMVPHVFKNYALAITDLKFGYFLLATILISILFKVFF